MISLIFPIAKCPTQTKARFGAKALQDWYCALLRAVAILQDLQTKGVEAYILIVTGFQMKGHRSEAAIFVEELELLGIKRSHILVLEKGFHTGDQVHIAEDYAREQGAKLIALPTVFHFWHFKYYSNPATEHRIVYGRPNLVEAFKDPLMPIVAWLVDRRFEWRLAFEEGVHRRRAAGDL